MQGRHNINFFQIICARSHKSLSKAAGCALLC